MKKYIPLGYEIRTSGTNDHYGNYTKLAGFYNGKMVAESRYIDIYGYRTCLRHVMRGIKLHYKYNIDKARSSE